MKKLDVMDKYINKLQERYTDLDRIFEFEKLKKSFIGESYEELSDYEFLIQYEQLERDGHGDKLYHRQLDKIFMEIFDEYFYELCEDLEMTLNKETYFEDDSDDACRFDEILCRIVEEIYKINRDKLKH